jgi:hypothetical protein
MDDNRDMYLFVREPYPTEGSVAVEKHNRRQAKRLMAALRPFLPGAAMSKGCAAAS